MTRTCDFAENYEKLFTLVFVALPSQTYEYKGEQALTVSGMSEPDHIREIIRESTKTEMIRQCPDVSQITAQHTLADLQKSGEILKLSSRHYTAHIRNTEKL